MKKNDKVYEKIKKLPDSEIIKISLYDINSLKLWKNNPRNMDNKSYIESFNKKNWKQTFEESKLEENNIIKQIEDKSKPKFDSLRKKLYDKWDDDTYISVIDVDGIIIVVDGNRRLAALKKIKTNLKEHEINNINIKKIKTLNTKDENFKEVLDDILDNLVKFHDGSEKNDNSKLQWSRYKRQLDKIKRKKQINSDDNVEFNFYITNLIINIYLNEMNVSKERWFTKKEQITYSSIENNIKKILESIKIDEGNLLKIIKEETYEDRLISNFYENDINLSNKTFFKYLKYISVFIFSLIEKKHFWTKKKFLVSSKLNAFQEQIYYDFTYFIQEKFDNNEFKEQKNNIVDEIKLSVNEFTDTCDNKVYIDFKNISHKNIMTSEEIQKIETKKNNNELITDEEDLKAELNNQNSDNKISTLKIKETTKKNKPNFNNLDKLKKITINNNPIWDMYIDILNVLKKDCNSFFKAPTRNILINSIAVKSRVLIENLPYLLSTYEMFVDNYNSNSVLINVEKFKKQENKNTIKVENDKLSFSKFSNNKDAYKFVHNFLQYNKWEIFKNNVSAESNEEYKHLIKKSFDTTLTISYFTILKDKVEKLELALNEEYMGIKSIHTFVHKPFIYRLSGYKIGEIIDNFFAHISEIIPIIIQMMLLITNEKFPIKYSGKNKFWNDFN